MGESAQDGAPLMDEELKELLDGLEDEHSARRDADEDARTDREIRSLLGEGGVEAVSRKFAGADLLASYPTVDGLPNGSELDIRLEEFTDREGTAE